MNLVKNTSKLFLFSFVFLSKKYILIIVRFKRRMRGSSHAIQNLIKVKLYFSTIQGELKIKACTEYLKDQNQTLSPFLKLVRVLLNSSRWSLMNVSTFIWTMSNHFCKYKQFARNFHHIRTFQL